MKPKLLEALEALGFSPIEAEVYVLLVQRPASSGYKVAQELGKAAAGVYKALDALALKGGVVVDDDGTKLWRAVPPDEMLGRLARQHEAQREAARRSLATLEPAASDERVYRLQSFDQVVQRFLQMVERATETIVVDLFPKSVRLVRESLERATERGLQVTAKLYTPCELDVSYQVVTPDAERLLDAWPLDWLNIVVDAEEHMLALVDVERGRVQHATYTGSTYLSLLYHSGITSEIQRDALGAAIVAGANASELRALHDKHHEYFSARVARGARTFLSQLHAGREPST